MRDDALHGSWLLGFHFSKQAFQRGAVRRAEMSEL
jgi:hypothetical protein